MEQKLDIKVPIKEELKKCMVFGVSARPAIGHILSYFGFSLEVLSLMQNLSHATRAYIVNAEGLPGFLVGVDILKFLREADLEEATKW